MRNLSVRKAAGTVHTNSTDEGVLDSYTIKANTLHAGKIIRVEFMARVTDNNSTDTVVIKVRIGATTLTGTAVITTTAVDSEDGDMCTGWLHIVSRGHGTSESLVCFGAANDADATGQAARHFAAIVGSINTKADLLVEVTADWSVAHAENDVQIEAFNVFELN